jgi:hypothetical protein
MKKITRDDVMDGDAYEREREASRRRIMVVKAKRRLPLGNHATLHFESRDTMLYQILEMLRAESSWDRPGAVEDEIEAYEPLVPGNGRLTATLMFEYETAEERTRWLSQLLGIDRHLWLQIGDIEPVAAVFDDAQVSPTRISSVQYVAWTLDQSAQDLIRTPGTVVRVVIDHPDYEALAVLSEETRNELATDLE